MGGICRILVARATAGLVGLGAALAAGPALAQAGEYELPWDIFAPGWEISGSNTIKFEYYDVDGDQAASPFPFQNEQINDDFDIQFSRQISQFQTIDGFFNGVINDSQYRANKDGLIAERANVTWRNGEGDTPFQLEFGDFFGFFSQRTFGSSLKGAQLELQPQFGVGDWTSSLVVFGGTRLDNFREGDAEDDMFAGASWLFGGELGGVAFNYVFNRQDDDGVVGTNAQTMSVSFNRRFSDGADGQFTINAESGWHMAEVLRNGGVADVQDGGHFLKIDGANGPLNYSAKFENYGADYAPRGGSVAADRRTLEGNAGWRFENGMQGRVRGQWFRDAVEQPNSTDTLVFGVGLSGPADPFGLEAWNFNLDAFAQTVRDEAGQNNAQTANLNLSLNGALTEVWSMRVSALATGLRDEVQNAKGDTEQLTLGFTRPFALDETLGDFLNDAAGSFDIGGTLRHDDSAGQGQWDAGPNVSVNLAKEAHSFNLSYNSLFQNPDGIAGDNINHSLVASYRFSEGPHAIGVDAEFQSRDPRARQDTQGYKLGVFYTFSFFKPESAPAAPPAPTPAADNRPIFDITAFKPGISADDAYDLADDLGLIGGVPFPAGIVFERPVFNDIAERQRFAMVLSRNRETLERSVIIVDLDPFGGIANAEQLYLDIQAKLARRYGRPREIREGDFSANLANDLADGRFVRNSEWRIDGAILRFGIPRRTDRVVRLEIQYAGRLPPTADPNWSVETLR